MIGGANSFYGITPEAFGAIGALVNFAVAFVVDKLTKEPPEHIQHMVEAVRTPRCSKALHGSHQVVLAVKRPNHQALSEVC